MKVNLHEVIKEVSNRTGYSMKDIGAVIKSLFEVITDEMYETNSVSITNFGVFEAYARRGGKYYNGAKKELVDMPERVLPKFRPSKNLRERLNDINNESDC